jgi:hypothetical protein
MPSSVIVATRKALVTDLAAQSAMAAVKVTYAWDPDALDREQVFTTRARGDQEPASLHAGPTKRNETGRFQVVVHVELVGASPEEADERAIALGKVVEERVAARKSDLGVTGLNWIVMESWEMNGGPSDRGSISQLFYTVRYNARLT